LAQNSIEFRVAVQLQMQLTFGWLFSHLMLAVLTVVKKRQWQAWLFGHLMLTTFSLYFHNSCEKTTVAKIPQSTHRCTVTTPSEPHNPTALTFGTIPSIIYILRRQVPVTLEGNLNRRAADLTEILTCLS